MQLAVAETVRGHMADDSYKGVSLDEGRPRVGQCPVCGKSLLYHGKVASCESNKRRRTEEGEWIDAEGCGFKVFTVFCGKTLTENQVRRLLAGERVKVGGLTWKGKSGRTAELVYDRASHKVTFAPRTDTKGARQRRYGIKSQQKRKCRRSLPAVGTPKASVAVAPLVFMVIAISGEPTGRLESKALSSAAFPMSDRRRDAT